MKTYQTFWIVLRKPEAESIISYLIANSFEEATAFIRKEYPDHQIREIKKEEDLQILFTPEAAANL